MAPPPPPRQGDSLPRRLNSGDQEIQRMIYLFTYLFIYLFICILSTLFDTSSSAAPQIQLCPQSLKNTLRESLVMLPMLL